MGSSQSIRGWLAGGMLAGVLLWPAVAARVEAQTNSWTAKASGLWSTAANWSAGLPTSSQSAILITNDTTKTVTVSSALSQSNRTISNLLVTAPAGTINTLLLTNLNAGAGTALRVLNDFSLRNGGSVSILSSTLQVDGAQFGVFSIDGTATLLSGSVLVTDTALFVGDVATGRFTVAGGSVDAGFVYVANLFGSQGTLTVAGGTVRVPFLGAGGDAAATGTVWITGGQLLATNLFDLISVGDFGVGSMIMSNGTVAAEQFSVGGLAGAQGEFRLAGGTNRTFTVFTVGTDLQATGTVWMSGGRLVVTNEFSSLIVGDSGVGSMTVSNGTVLASDVFVANAFGSAGTLTVAGGTNQFLGSLSVAADVNTTGTVLVSGGQLVVTNALTILGGDSFGSPGGAARMTVTGGRTLGAGVMVGATSGSQGTLSVAGGIVAVRGPLDIGKAGGTGNVHVSAGVLAVTNTPATVTSGTGLLIDGDIFVSAGSLVATNAPILLGSAGSGSLTVSNGTMQAADFFLGNNARARGTLTVAGGTNCIFSSLILGTASCSATGIVTVTGGNLFVTNATGTAALDARSGTCTISSGFVQIDRLFVTNACARFIKSGGQLSAAFTNLAPNLSAVGDGIPNSWKLQFGLDPFDPAVAGADPDGDGLTNLEEFMAGTDPTDSSSPFRILAVAPEGINFRVTWTTVRGRTNVLQTTLGAADGSFATNSFSALATNFAAGAGVITNTFLHLGGATNVPARYYRVRLVP
jgi:hypothetical protein